MRRLLNVTHLNVSRPMRWRESLGTLSKCRRIKEHIGVPQNDSAVHSASSRATFTLSSHFRKEINVKRLHLILETNYLGEKSLK